MMEQRRVLIRADGSPTLGMGHLSRAAALAGAFREHGVEVVFVCREYDDRAIRRVEEAGHRVNRLDLPLSLEDDAAAVRTLADELGVWVIVIDLSNEIATAAADAYTRYLHSVAEGRRTVIIDDLTRTTFPKAMVVNPSAGVLTREYDMRFGPVLLLGPRYAPLHHAFRGPRPTRMRTGPGVRTVAVCLGGGVTMTPALPVVLRGLREGLGTCPTLRLVARWDDGMPPAVADELAAFEGRTELLANLPHLAGVFAGSDLAIVSGGVTKYEAAAMGTPAVMVATVHHQVAWARAFAETGAAVYAGFAEEISASEVANACRYVAEEPVWNRMAAVAGSIIDGRGALRVVDAAFSPWWLEHARGAADRAAPGAGGAEAKR